MQYQFVTCSLLNPFFITFVFEAEIIRFSSNFRVSVELLTVSLAMHNSLEEVGTNC